MLLIKCKPVCIRIIGSVVAQLEETAGATCTRNPGSVPVQLRLSVPSIGFGELAPGLSGKYKRKELFKTYPLQVIGQIRVPMAVS